MVQERLTAEGFISVQAGSAAWDDLVNFAAVTRTLKSIFPLVCPYQVDIPSFGGPWGFCLASPSLNTPLLPPQEVDHRISARLSGGLRFYDGLTQQGIFSLPRHLRQKLSKGKRVITDSKPLVLQQS